MPPKVKVTKDDIIRAAFEIVREQGEDALNARNVASMLECSTQPIFSNFTSMEEVRYAVICKADAMYASFMKEVTDSGLYPPYKASGMSYIRFAAEEKELFKLLYMRDRSDEKIPETSDLDEQMYGMVSSNTGLDTDTARLFHLEMWAFVHGIAAMLATGFLTLDTELISRMLTDAYQGLRKQFEGE